MTLPIGAIGPTELAVIVGVLALLFGPTLIPRAARSAGRVPGEFRKGRQEIGRELEEMKHQ